VAGRISSARRRCAGAKRKPGGEEEDWDEVDYEGEDENYEYEL